MAGPYHGMRRTPSASRWAPGGPRSPYTPGMLTLSTPPWRLARDLPWHVFTSPLDKWAAQPSFVIGEYLFLSLAALCLWHAGSQVERRRHLTAWFAALLAGTANDMF